MSEKPLLEEIEDFISLHRADLTDTGFGLAAVNDGKFVAQLRGGRRVWPETAEKVRAFIRDYPASAERAAEHPQQARAAG